MTLPLFRRALALAVSLVLGAGIVAVAAPAAQAVPNDTTLLDIAVSTGTLDPAFAAGTTEYDLTVPSSTDAVSILPFLNPGTTAVVRDSDGEQRAVIRPAPGPNRVTITVTELAPSPVPLSTTYTLNIFKEYDLMLQGLTVSSGTLSPLFDPNVEQYTLDVPHETTSVTLTPGAIAAGNAVAVRDSGNIVRADIPLIVGANSATVTVTSPDAQASKQYSIQINRAAAPYVDVELSGLVLSEGTLSPTFSSATTMYNVSLPHTTTSLTVTPGPVANGNTVTVRDSGGMERYTIPIYAAPTLMTVTVASPNGAETKQYTLFITRAPKPAGPLVALYGLAVSEGTLSPTFDSAVENYTVDVPFTTKSITVTPGISAPNNTVYVKNSGNVVGNTIALGVGSNAAIVTVSAPGATDRQYVVHITRGPAPTDNVDLADIGLSAGTLSPAFSANTLNYSATVPYGVRSMQITPTAAKAGHTVTVNNVPVAAGESATVPISFSPNGDGFGITVTAANGATKTYAVTIKRDQPSNNSDMIGLSLSNGSLSPAYSDAQASYTATVPYLTTSTTVTSATAHAMAVLRVNGRDTSSGVASAPVALTVGANTITVAITAEDTLTTTTRTITITRAAPNLDLGSLSVSGGTLSPAFDSATTAYTLALPYTTSSIDVAAAAVEKDWTVAIKGKQAANSQIAIPVGSSTVPVTVTAKHGETRSYTIAVTRQAPSADTSLSGITLSAGSLSPMFTATQSAYTAAVGYNTESITVGATAASAVATVAINGNNSASEVVPLVVGKNTITILTTAQSGAKSTTSLVVTRDAAPVAKMQIALGFAAGDSSGNAPFDVSGANLRPGSSATVTMHSTPVVLATGTVRPDGTIALSARIPAGAEFGAHRLVFESTAADGSAVSTTAWFSALRNGTIGAVSLTAPVAYAETPTPTPSATTTTPASAAAKPGAPAGAIASTGIDGGFALMAGFALAAAGAVLIVVRTATRRRRRTVA